MAERKPWGLTDLRAITEEATSEWIHGDKQGMDLEDFTNRAIADVAAKTVVEWLIANNTANYVEKYNGWPMQLDEKHWQAIQQGVGL